MLTALKAVGIAVAVVIALLFSAAIIQTMTEDPTPVKPAKHSAPRDTTDYHHHTVKDSPVKESTLKGDDNKDGIVDEDEAGWDCHTMGNKVCGPQK